MIDIITKLSNLAVDELYIDIKSTHHHIEICQDMEMDLMELQAQLHKMALESNSISVKIYQCDEGIRLSDYQVVMVFDKQENGEFRFDFKRALTDVKRWSYTCEIPFSTRRMGNGIKHLLNQMIEA